MCHATRLVLELPDKVDETGKEEKKADEAKEPVGPKTIKYVIVESMWASDDNPDPQGHKAVYLVVEDGEAYLIPEKYGNHWHADPAAPDPRAPQSEPILLPEDWEHWDRMHDLPEFAPTARGTRMTSERHNELCTTMKQGRYYLSKGR